MSSTKRKLYSEVSNEMFSEEDSTSDLSEREETQDEDQDWNDGLLEISSESDDSDRDSDDNITPSPRDLAPKLTRHQKRKTSTTSRKTNSSLDLNSLHLAYLPEVQLLRCQKCKVLLIGQLTVIQYHRRSCRTSSDPDPGKGENFRQQIERTLTPLWNKGLLNSLEAFQDAHCNMEGRCSHPVDDPNLSLPDLPNISTTYCKKRKAKCYELRYWASKENADYRQQTLKVPIRSSSTTNSLSTSTST